MTASPSDTATAHVIIDEAEALALGEELARRFTEGAAERDAQRLLPHAELDELSASGLLGITVPRNHGGAGASTRTLLEVFRLLATADPNIAQIPHSHLVYINVLKEKATAVQQQSFFCEVLAGKRFGNAQAEAEPPQDITTTLTPPRTATTCSTAPKPMPPALLAH